MEDGRLVFVALCLDACCYAVAACRGNLRQKDSVRSALIFGQVRGVPSIGSGVMPGPGTDIGGAHQIPVAGSEITAI